MKSAELDLDSEDEFGVTGQVVEQFGADVAAGVFREMREGVQAELVMAELSQQRIAQATERIESAHIEGIGQRTMEIDLTSYLYWAHRTDGACWRDKGFADEFKRDNEAVRARNGEGKAVILVERKLKPQPAA